MKYCRSYGFNCEKCIYDKCIDSRGKYESGLDIENISDFADYLIENASYAFEHQDRELLEKVLRDYNRIK